MVDKKISKRKERQGGFFKLIFIIIVALLLMKYFNLTVSGVVDWFKSFFGSVLQ